MAFSTVHTRPEVTHIQNVTPDLTPAALVIVLLGLVAAVAWRLRRSRTSRALVVHRPPPVPAQPVRAVSAPRPQAIGRPAEVHVHHHWRGLSAEDAAAANRQAQAIDNDPPGSVTAY